MADRLVPRPRQVQVPERPLVDHPAVAVPLPVAAAFRADVHVAGAGEGRGRYPEDFLRGDPGEEGGQDRFVEDGHVGGWRGRGGRGVSAHMLCLLGRVQR